jgi:flavin reductase (DIM6/NTAB) family NADH-FMN oxidoreductase RutF
MPIPPDQFRDALRLHAAGVTVVTAGTGEEVHGMTVSAFSSVSMEPPLVAVVINQAQSIHPLLRDDGAPFAVNLLAEDQEDLSNRFAFADAEERFEPGRWSTAVTGAPILDDALAWLDCTVAARHTAGSHVIYVGRVEASGSPRDGDRPLLYWDRGYRRLTADGGGKEGA